MEHIEFGKALALTLKKKQVAHFSKSYLYDNRALYGESYITNTEDVMSRSVSQMEKLLIARWVIPKVVDVPEAERSCLIRKLEHDSDPHVQHYAKHLLGDQNAFSEEIGFILHTN